MIVVDGQLVEVTIPSQDLLTTDVGNLAVAVAMWRDGF